MKILKIENRIGMYYTKEEKYASIDMIGKEDIIYLMEIIVNEENIEIEESNEEDKKINNIAQKIIYDQIYVKFKEIYDIKESIIQESNEKYKEVFKKYLED